MEYRCPIYESSKFLCDRPAHYLVAGTSICGYHALHAGLIVTIAHDGVIVTSDPARMPYIQQAATRNEEGNDA
jgi:hypothetical protein